MRIHFFVVRLSILKRDDYSHKIGNARFPRSNRTVVAYVIRWTHDSHNRLVEMIYPYE